MRKAGSCEHFLLSIFKLVTCHLSPGTGTIRAMKISIPLTTILLATLIAAPSFAQTTASSPAAATRLFGSFERPAESAGDDETNDGAVEVE